MKVKETGQELEQFYEQCKRAGTEWTSERLFEVEEFLENKFDAVFVSGPTTVLQKQ